jgi:hypothetical protein
MMLLQLFLLLILNRQLLSCLLVAMRLTSAEVWFGEFA